MNAWSSLSFVKTKGDASAMNHVRAGQNRRSRHFLAIVSVVGAVVLLGAMLPAAASTPTAKKPTGTPLLVGVISQDSGASISPDTADGIDAWVWYANHNGGVSGRPVAVDRCDTGGDPTKSDACARKHIASNELVELSSFDRYSSVSFTPASIAAGLGSICTAPNTPAEQNSVNGFCIGGGSNDAYTFLAQYYKKKINATKFAFARVNTTGGDATSALLKANLTANGQTLIDIAVQAGAPDLLPAAQAAMSANPDVIFIGTGHTESASLFTAFQTLGNKKPIAGSQLVLGQTILAQSGDASNKVIEADPVALSSAAKTDPAMYKNYLKAVAAVGHGPTNGSILGFAAGLVFADMVKQVGVGNVSRASILNFIKTGEVKNVPFLPATVSRATAPTNETAVVNPSLIVQQWQSSKGAYKLIAGAQVFTNAR